ncbi:MAG TPA: hypothetical protein VN040_16055 [Pseudosphingobacterium sp.]|nr:hypothetical protein [Pseudosphingobacterium sp.]
MNKNIRKILFGIGVSGLALGASAFTNRTVETNLQMRYWGNDEATGQYIELPGPPSIENCNPDETETCVVQSESTSLPSELPYNQATPANGVNPHPSAAEGFYQ